MMNDPPQDEARLLAKEAQMRRALGLDNAKSTTTDAKPAAGSNGQHRPRHFVRDGEIPVTIIHKDDGIGTNQLEAARQTIRSLTATREELERSLMTARETIRDLQTKLAHEHIGRDEAMHRKQAIEESLRSAQADFAAERNARQQAEERLAETLRERLNGRAQAVSPVPQQATEPRRRGRTQKIEEPESEFVEWWKPGWQERYR